MTAVVGFYRHFPEFFSVGHIDPYSALDEKADELLTPSDDSRDRRRVAGFVVECAPDYFAVGPIEADDTGPLPADHRINHPADDDRRAGEAVTPGAGHAAFFADEIHAQLGVVEFPLDIAVPGIQTVEGASAALGEHLSTIDDRRAARPTRALAVFENRRQPCSPLFRSVGSGEGDHGFLPTAIFEMEHRAIGDNRRRQSLSRFDFPNHSGLVGQLG